LFFAPESCLREPPWRMTPTSLRARQNLSSAHLVMAVMADPGCFRSTQRLPYPKIAGQNQKYLVNALKAYKSGHRVGTYAALMAETANNLSDADIGNLAAYLASLDDSK
jgi:hypothetical protein